MMPADLNPFERTLTSVCEEILNCPTVPTKKLVERGVVNVWRVEVEWRKKRGKVDQVHPSTTKICKRRFCSVDRVYD